MQDKQYRAGCLRTVRSSSIHADPFVRSKTKVSVSLSWYHLLSNFTPPTATHNNYSTVHLVNFTTVVLVHSSYKLSKLLYLIYFLCHGLYLNFCVWAKLTNLCIFRSRSFRIYTVRNFDKKKPHPFKGTSN